VGSPSKWDRAGALNATSESRTREIARVCGANKQVVRYLAASAGASERACKEPSIYLQRLRQRRGTRRGGANCGAHSVGAQIPSRW
jgi:hypothetical protein